MRRRMRSCSTSAPSTACRCPSSTWRRRLSAGRTWRLGSSSPPRTTSTASPATSGVRRSRRGRPIAYEAIAVTDGGTLAGAVTYEGTPPAPTKIEVTKDPEVCGKDKTAPNLVIGQGNGIANVVVAVQATKGKKLEVPATNPVFYQKTCEFHPHVLAFPAGSTIDVLNSDGILHNLHTTSTVNPSSNQAQPKFKPKIQIKVEK